MIDLTPESSGHPDRDTRDLAPVPPSELEQALTVLRQAIDAAYGLGADGDMRATVALIALDVLGAPARALDILDGEFSIFTLRDKADVIACVQDEHCERKYEVRGKTLREAVNAAAHCAQAERRAEELEGR